MYTFIALAAQFGLFFIVYPIVLAGRDESLLIGGLLGLPLYALITYHEMRQERWFFSPVVIFMLMSFLHLGAVPLWTYATFKLGYADEHMLGFTDVSDQVGLAHGWGILGAACYYAGYKFAFRRPWNYLSDFLIKISPQYPVKFKYTLALIGAGWIWSILKEMGVPFHRLGHIDSMVTTTLRVGAPLMILTSQYVIRNGEVYILPAGKKRFFLALLTAVAYIYFFALGSGMRFPFLYVSIIFIWGYLIQLELPLRQENVVARLKVSVKPVLFVVSASVVIWLIILPYGKQIAAIRAPWRGEVVREEKELEEEYKWYEFKESFPSEGVWTLLDRLAGAGQHGLGACVMFYDYLPIEKPVHYVVLIGVIPRLFWPHKPFISRGAYFSIMVGSGTDPGVGTEEEATTATAMTAIGELYWSYGTNGILIGMFLLGFLYAFSYKVFSIKFPLNPLRSAVVLALFFPAFMWYESDASGYFVHLIWIWVVFTPILILDLPSFMKQLMLKR